MKAVSNPPPAIKIRRFAPGAPPVCISEAFTSTCPKPAPTAAVPSIDDTRKSLRFMIWTAIRLVHYTAPMQSSSVGRSALLLLATSGLLAASLAAAPPPDWGRSRGPNGSGISTATNIPTDFGPGKNLLWRLELPPGHSSPIIQDDRIYLTGFRADQLVTIAIDRLRGKILWERPAPEVK